MAISNLDSNSSAEFVALQKRAVRRSKALKLSTQLHHTDRLEMREAASYRHSVSDYLRECGYTDTSYLYADDSAGNDY